ncbi:DPP IV N-terminal domain-containing protein [Luteimonas sp. R10]|uniref:S9 family peptidase n=1 Tax=Luteimonas sp. R10 TaxID=3108176 RepID=UPI0030887320|nr:DPP IV N-terminal domain-containing protein [Luteimonas sp. R10]
MTADDYRRAERMLPDSAAALVDGLKLKPHWIGEGSDFWYQTRRDGKPRRLLVDTLSGEQRPILEHEHRRERADEALPGAAVSPDGRWVVSMADYDLQVRHLGEEQVRRLTRDGRAGHAYGSRSGLQVPPAADDASPVVYFSPDSRRILTYRLHYADVPELHLVQARGGDRPDLRSYRYAMPGGPVAEAEWVILDLADGARVDVRHPPTPIRPNSDLQVQWSDDGRRIFFLEEEAGFARAWIRAIDADTGTVLTLLEERTDTVLDRQPILRVFGDRSELIWSSERDGWRHLYLVDARTGGIKRQLTRGEWSVQARHGVLHVDPEQRWVYFMAHGRETGRDPYYRHLYRVRLDGTGLTLLTPENADHSVDFSADGAVFVDTYSRVDSPPVSVLRMASGQQVAELQRADIRRLLATGWRAPQPFSVKARDGSTDLFGVMFLPSHFDPDRRYPVIDSIYPGPQNTRVPKSFTLDHAQALAELGFIVVQIDGMGTPKRSRAFREVSYRNLGDAGGLDDHVAGLRQLAQSRPWMDLSRVGIYGHSGGGFASARAILAHPDFYKVAVSSSGNHDQRIYHAGWGERYQGYPQGDNYAGLDNASLAGELKGKLLLVHGDADDNVHPAHTLALAQALIEAGKDFDLLILPGQAHAFEGRANDYFIRRRWDYFVRHLLGSEPPPGYRLGSDVEVDRTTDRDHDGTGPRADPFLPQGEAP